MSEVPLQGPRGVLGGWAFSYGRSTPVHPEPHARIQVNGNPILMDFSSQGTSGGYSRKFAANYDAIFKKKPKDEA